MWCSACHGHRTTWGGWMDTSAPISPFVHSGIRPPRGHSSARITHRNASLIRAPSYYSPMHVLIATTGVLSPGPVVDFTARLLGAGGRVSVTTVIEVPRTFLEDLRSESWHPLENGDAPQWTEDRRRVDCPLRRRARPPPHRAGAQFAARRRPRRRAPSTSRARIPAKTISELADQLDVDVVILGATRRSLINLPGRACRLGS